VPELLQRFIDSFVKAVTVEMEAMRQRLGSFEVPLADGTAIERDGDPHQASPTLVIIALRNLVGDDSYCTDSRGQVAEPGVARSHPRWTSADACRRVDRILSILVACVDPDR
jgi:hypothetical protein